MSTRDKPSVDYYLELQKASAHFPDSHFLLKHFIDPKYINSNGGIIPSRAQKGQMIVVLRHLIDNHHRPVSYEELSNQLWSLENLPLEYDRILRIHVCRLRKLLKSEYHIASIGHTHCYRLFYVGENKIAKFKKKDVNPRKKKSEEFINQEKQIAQQKSQQKALFNEKRYNRNRDNLMEWHRTFLGWNTYETA